MGTALNYLNQNGFNAADTLVRQDPFPFMIAHGILNEQYRVELAQDFPKYKEAGFFPHSPDECGFAINQLIEEVISPEFADLLGHKIGIEQLSQYPTLVTICRHINRRHGTIHTDSRSKVATALIYLNEKWDGTSDGCLRFLASSDDVHNTLVPEIIPLFGSLAFFKRTENSFHGHLPCEGERRVLQIAWIINEKERDRKIKRGSFSRFLKGVFGGLDKKIGRDRDPSKGHLN